MNDRILNFSAGPATLPEEVLRDAQEALWELGTTGIGVMEHSHRGGPFKAVAEGAEAACRKLAGIPDDYAVLFLQGGASTQFFQLPAHWLADDATADYLITGSWSVKAAKEAARYGTVHEAASTKDRDFNIIPRADEIQYSDAPTYVHFTSNNTIFGTQWQEEPAAPGEAWLACDASSDIFSRPVDITRYGVLYAGAQKNLGPSGVTLVIVRRDLLDTPVRDLPTMLRYATHAEQGSLYNTPPTFGIYVMGRVFRWIAEQGGLEGMAKRNREKGQILYDALEAQDFYSCTAGEGSRSLMNVTFRTPNPELDTAFVKQAEAAGLSGLKGHRSVGGMRASIYNAFPKEGCEVLASFLRDFAAKQG
ncbi:MAG: 3-phosphoserine/phosphohydroxythreonine transaminase [bacterium]|nr:3-phosphoserine/phosphohydroxythreonine transaminase [bacterium]